MRAGPWGRLAGGVPAFADRAWALGRLCHVKTQQGLRLRPTKEAALSGPGLRAPWSLASRPGAAREKRRWLLGRQIGARGPPRSRAGGHRASQPRGIRFQGRSLRVGRVGWRDRKRRSGVAGAQELGQGGLGQACGPARGQRCTGDGGFGQWWQVGGDRGAGGGEQTGRWDVVTQRREHGRETSRRCGWG